MTTNIKQDDDNRGQAETHEPIEHTTDRFVHARASRFRLLSISDVKCQASPEWRVEGLLSVGALSMVYAPQEQFKTFFALDLALSVAHGQQFHGRRVKQGPIVYVLGEGRGGLKNRIQAWLDERDVTYVESAFFVLEAVQFKQRDDVKALRAQIDARGITPAMLFIDTFARSAVGIDENQAMEIGVWIDAVTNLQQALDVDVVALHHAQKGSSDSGSIRERGSSAFIGAVDTVIRLKKGQDTVKVTCEKQKDAERFEDFTLAVKVRRLGTNEHGDDTSSCVLVDSDASNASGSGLPRELLLMLSSLTAFQGETGRRTDWWPKTGLTERTFDRHREKLMANGWVESVRRGTFRVTDKGRLIMGLSLPSNGHDRATQFVAATPPTPGGGGVATGQAVHKGRTDLPQDTDRQETLALPKARAVRR
jgi:hypothetical protein